MARPIKNNADYFPHDAGMRNHKKVKAIITKFGLDGYAIYSMILESLTSSENFKIKISCELDWELISADMYTSSDKLKSLLEYFISLGLIQKEDNEFRSDSLIERFEAVLNKRLRAKKTFEERREIEKLIGKKIQSTNGINREVRLVVFEKYGFKCNKCNVNDPNVLDVHHLTPRHKGGSDDIDNLELLCANCHRKAHLNDNSVTETPFRTTENLQSKVNESKVNESKVNESKVNESKVKQTKLSITATSVATIEDRTVIFLERVKAYEGQYEPKMLKEFLEYWCEKNPNGKKMRFEMQKVFDVGRRLSTWKNNTIKIIHTNGTHQRTPSTNIIEPGKDFGTFG